jgi:hypothetical protein
MRAFRSPRYANVAATLALLLSLGGTATAASITLVTGSQVKDGSLTLSDLAPASVHALRQSTASGGAASSLRLAAYTNPPPQTLPDDTTFHSVWSIGFKVKSANQIFILTGNFGNGSTPGCPSGFYTYSERALLDGSLLWERDSDGTTTGTPPNGFMTFATGRHTLDYQLRGDCPGYPVEVPAQQVALIPFTLP